MGKLTKARAVAHEKPRRGRGRPQVRSDEETRAIVFEAARQEFATSGYESSSMEYVARRAGISTKTLYRLIPNKAALFEAMVTDRLDQFVARIRFRPCEGAEIEEALKAVLLACADLVLNADVVALQRMVLAESEKFPEIAKTFYTKAMRRTVTALANWLRIEKERGLIAVEDPEIAAGILLGMLAFEPHRAAMFGRKPLPGRKDLEKRVSICAKLFLQGALASELPPRIDGQPV